MYSKKPSLPAKPSVNKTFNKNVIIRGSLWFALLSIASVAAVFFYSHTGETIKALAGIRSKYVLVCFAMVFVDLMLGSWRNHIFIRKLTPGISHWVSFKANVANMFMGAVTPFHGGAGPAQLYVYNRNGVPLHDGFLVSLINMGATLLFMPLAGLFAIWVMQDQLNNGIISILLRYGFTVFLIFLMVFLIAFWKPVWIGALLEKTAGIISLFLPSRRERLMTWASIAHTKISEHQQISKQLLQNFPLLFPCSLLITTGLYLNKYCMQYVILLGLGIESNLADVISIQVLIQFMIYFAPSPGGSGFAEASIAVLFSKLVPRGVLPVFTLLQRSFLLFFPALIGAVLFLRLLRNHISAK